MKRGGLRFKSRADRCCSLSLRNGNLLKLPTNKALDTRLFEMFELNMLLATSLVHSMVNHNQKMKLSTKKGLRSTCQRAQKARLCETTSKITYCNASRFLALGRFWGLACPWIILIHVHVLVLVLVCTSDTLAPWHPGRSNYFGTSSSACHPMVHPVSS